MPPDAAQGLWGLQAPGQSQQKMFLPDLLVSARLRWASEARKGRHLLYAPLPGCLVHQELSVPLSSYSQRYRDRSRTQPQPEVSQAAGGGEAGRREASRNPGNLLCARSTCLRPSHQHLVKAVGSPPPHRWRCKVERERLSHLAQAFSKSQILSIPKTWRFAQRRDPWLQKSTCTR